MRAEARSRLSFNFPVSGAWKLRGLSIAAVGAMWMLTACNSVTGSESFRFKSEASSAEGGDPTGGAGGSGGSGAGPSACVYPDTSYGNQLKDIVDPNLTWKGYAVGTTTADQITDINIKDYYDCDGSKGINAILILQSATWCGICDGEAQNLNEHMDGGWKDMGIQVITLMIENASGQKATTTTAYQWKTAANHDLVSTAVVADPNFSFAPVTPDGTIGLPVILVINPRTMEITSVQQGASGSYPELEALAKANAVAK